MIYRKNKHEPRTKIAGTNHDPWSFPQSTRWVDSDELTNNPTAIKMLLHYYGQLLDDNTALRNNNNTLETYVSAYKTKKSNAATGMVLLTVSNVSVAFGVNLLTSISATVWPGISSLVIGMALITAGIYFSFFKDV